MCLDEVKGRRKSFPLLVEHSHVTKILENASICHLARNTEASCYRATSGTWSGDLLVVKHNVEPKRVHMGGEHVRYKSCKETQKTVLQSLPVGKMSVKAKNKEEKRPLGPHRAHSRASRQYYAT